MVANAMSSKKAVAVSNLFFREWLSIYWTCWWIGFVVSVLALALAFAIGAGVGLLGGLVARGFVTTPEERLAARELIILIGRALGFGASFLMMPVYTRWLLSSRPGIFRLLLVRSNSRKSVSVSSLLFPERLSIYWGFWWRIGVVGLLGMALILVIKFSIDTLLGGIGIWRYLINLIIGLLITPIYVHWLLFMPIGKFRVVLVKEI